MKFLKLVVLSAFLAGCAGSFTGRAPETRTVALPQTPSKVYMVAQKAMAEMGTQMTAMDGKSSLAGIVHGAVILNVQIQEQGTGTLMTVTASIPPGKLTLGSLTELDEFVKRFTALEQAHVR